jgi:hypothetical protein
MKRAFVGLLLSCWAVLTPAYLVQLQKWTLNMNEGTIDLIFNAGMDVTTLNASGLTIQQNGSIPWSMRPDYPSMATVRLTDNTTSQSATGGVSDITLTLGFEDHHALQSTQNLATSLEDSWITLDASFMLDMAGVETDPIDDQTAMQATSIQGDYTRPFLRYYNVDMTLGVISLFFNEPVDVGSINQGGIVLRNLQNYSNTNGNPESTYTLTQFTYTDSPNNTLIDLIVGQGDLDQIKGKRNLFVSPNTTFLSMDPSFIRNMAGLQVAGFDRNHTMQARNYFEDVMHPYMIFFTLDINLGLLRLTFNEMVDVETMDMTQLTLQSHASNSSSVTNFSSLALTNASFTPNPNGPYVIVKLSPLDKMRLTQNLTALAWRKANTFISFSDRFCEDMRPNKVVPIPATNAYATNKFIQVGLERYTVDINGAPNNASIHLHFNGLVNPRTLDVRQITLQNKASLGAAQTCSGVYAPDCNKYTLTVAGSYTDTPGTASAYIKVSILQHDLDQIKLRLDLATRVDNTFLAIGSAVVRDTNGDDVSPLYDADVLYPPVVAEAFTADAVRPTLLYYALDMTLGLVLMTFSEAMLVGSMNVSKIRLQGHRAMLHDVFHDLTGYPASVTSPNGWDNGFKGGGTVSPSPNGVELLLVLGQYDLNLLKTMRGLATGRSFTYAVLQNFSFTDMAGNSVVDIPDGAGQLVANYTADVQSPSLSDFNKAVGVRPTLTRWDMDMDEGLITMVLSEPIDPLSFDPTGISLMDSHWGNQTKQGEGVYTQDGTYTLTNGTGVYRTYLLNDPLSFVDQQKAAQPKSRVANEDIQDGANVLFIKLSFYDRNQIAVRTSLCVTKESTFLNMRSSTMTDFAGNPVTAITSDSMDVNVELHHGQLLDIASGLDGFTEEPGLMVTNYTADTQRPVLESFTVDMNAGVVQLFFNEAVDTKTLDVTRFTLQANNNTRQAGIGTGAFGGRGGEFMTLTNVSGTYDTPSTNVTIRLGQRDFDSLKRKKSLCRRPGMTALAERADGTYPVSQGGAESLRTDYVSEYSCNLVVEPLAVRDMVGLYAFAIADASKAEIWDGEYVRRGRGKSLVPTTYYADGVPPALLRWRMDWANATLKLTFSEAVDRDTLDLAAVRVQARGFSEAGGVHANGTVAGRAAGYSNRSFVHLTGASAVVDLLPSCTETQPVSTRQATHRTPRPIFNNTICALELGQPMVSLANVSVYEKDVDVFVKLGAADLAALGAAMNATGLLNYTAPGRPSVYATELPGHPAQTAAQLQLATTVTHDAALGSTRFVTTATGGVAVTHHEGFRVTTSTSVTTVTVASTRPGNLTGVHGAYDRYDVATAAAVADNAEMAAEAMAAALLEVTAASVRANRDALQNATAPPMALGFDRTPFNFTHAHRLPGAFGVGSTVPLASPGRFNASHSYETFTQSALGKVNSSGSGNQTPSAGEVAGGGNGSVTTHTVTTRSAAPVNAELSFAAGSVFDFSANAVLAVGGDETVLDASAVPPTVQKPPAALALAPSVCGACPLGTYESRPCTRLDDRICTPCTVCATDLWHKATCTPTADTVCQRCATCSYAHFVSTPCSSQSDPVLPGQDTVCTRCKVCGIDLFETRPCEVNLDRMCQSCDSCSLSPAQERRCRGASVAWREINCCWDTDGNKVKPCKDLGYEEMKISARDSRRDEVWCKAFDKDKKQCMDVMNGNTNVPMPSYGVVDTNRVVPGTAAPHEPWNSLPLPKARCFTDQCEGSLVQAIGYPDGSRTPEVGSTAGLSAADRVYDVPS